MNFFFFRPSNGHLGQKLEQTQQSSTKPRFWLFLESVKFLCLLSLLSLLSWGATFDFRERNFPKPTNPSRNLKMFIQENSLWKNILQSYVSKNHINSIHYSNGNLVYFCYFLRNIKLKALFGEKIYTWWFNVASWLVFLE